MAGVVMAMIILTEEQRNDALALNAANVPFGMDPRLIDNPIANALGHGTLVGRYIVAARCLNDVNLQAWWPMLTGLPIYVLDGETLFLPPEPEED